MSERVVKEPHLYVDAHVHIHDCFDLQEFFTAAAVNFSCHSGQLCESLSTNRVLCMTESQGDNKFADIARLADSGSEDDDPDTRRWNFHRSADPACLLARHPELGEIVVIAGRQVVTAEKIEVLGLGSTEAWQDGAPASDVIDALASTGSLPVLPWGFGKWLGARRGVVRDLIERYEGGMLHLGDNSGRPAIMPEPPEFELARRKNYRILPGTDPLPFRSERRKAGSFGFKMCGRLSSESPWSDLRDKLVDPTTSLSSFGRLETPIRFLRNQIAMQYVSRTRRYA
jgi:hypothetical protein